MAGEKPFWASDLAANRGSPLPEQKERVGIASSEENTESSRQARARARAEFILKYGIAPEDVSPTKNIPGDITKTGEEYLDTIKDKGLVNKIRMLSEGRMSWPKGAALRNPAMAELISAASIYDPSLDEANAATRVATRRDFTSGMTARNITALNTAIGHLASLKRYAAALNNSSFPDLNSFINSIQSKHLGDPRVNNYRTAADAFATELAKVFKGQGAPSVTEIEDWKKRTNENMSPEQFEGFVKTGADLLNSRINALGEQYVKGMSRSVDPVTLLSPHAQELYKTIDRPLASEGTQRIGIDERVPQGTQIAGEDAKGFRFSPESEAKMLEVFRAPDATPEAATKLLVDTAVSEGLIKPEQRTAYAAATLPGMQEFFKQPPEARAQTRGINYENIDRTASENAGLGASVAQAVRNIPESGAQMLQGIINMPEALGTMGTAAGEVLGGAEKTPTADALKAAIAERYGSPEALKRTAVTDPLGLGADLSTLLTGGGTLAARLPGAAGRIGEGVATAGRVLDPLSAMVGLATEGAPATLSALANRYGTGRAGQLAADVTSEAAALPSGVGGAALREGFEAGRSKGLAGRATPQSEAFTANMRRPAENAGNIVDVARQAVENLREQASARYRAEMAKFGQTPTPLSPGDLIRTVRDMKPKNFDTMIDAPHRPADHLAWQQINDTVEHYVSKAMQDPSLLEPLAVDQFKQDLYSIGSKIGGQTDRDAARIAGNTYRAVRKMLTDHDPVYAEIMKPYADAAEEAASLESGFSLSSPRGKPVNIDSATRRLQSIFRNNANTNYGQRAAQGQRLGELDTSGTLMPSLAGQTASSWTPRGIRAGIEGAGAAGLLLHGGLAAVADPNILAALAAASPRVSGELAYGAGRVAGAGARGAREVAASPLGMVTRGTAKALGDLYQRRPAAALAGAQIGARGEDVDRELLNQRYGVDGVSLLPRDPFDEELEKARLLREYGAQ